MALLEDTTKGHGKDGFYFADGGYVLAHDVFRVMAETLYSIGLSEEPSPNTYTEEELNKYKVRLFSLINHPYHTNIESDRFLGRKYPSYR